MKRRGDHLYERNNGILCFRYKDSQDDAWKEKSTGTADVKAARKFKKDWDRRNEDGTLPNDKAEWTVEQACTRWVDQHAARLGSHKARSNEQSYLRQLIRRMGSKKLKAITLDHLKDYQRRRREQVRERPINLGLGILINVLKEANLLRGTLEKYKRLREPESEVGEALTIGELQRLEAMASSNDAWEVAYCAELLAANTGMRGGEIKRVRMGMVDLETRRIRITRRSTKTDRGARWVELNRAATEATQRLHRRAQLLGASEPDHFLLPADLSRHTKKADPLKGRRGFDASMHQMSWDTAWRRLRSAAGLPRLRFHSLRHTFITMQAERGTPVQVVQDLVGHMSAAVTRHYTHISDNVARAAVEKLDSIRQAPCFVDKFVDESSSRETPDSKRLN